MRVPVTTSLSAPGSVTAGFYDIRVCPSRGSCISTTASHGAVAFLSHPKDPAMTQNDLNRAVARATGETISTVAAMGFVPLTDVPIEREPLVVDWDELDQRRRFSLFQQPSLKPVTV